MLIVYTIQTAADRLNSRRRRLKWRTRQPYPTIINLIVNVIELEIKQN